MQTASHQQSRYHNLRRRNWTPNVGEKVLCKDHPLSKRIDGFAAKLASRYDEPFNVKAVKSPDIIILAKESDNSKYITHLNKVRNLLRSKGEMSRQYSI